TLIILTAGVDLSCGTVMALGGIVMTKLAAEHGIPVPVAIGAGLAVTTLLGAVNGLLVSAIKLPPFIVTLGTLNIAFAITQLYSSAQTITELPATMTALGATSGVLLTLVLYAIAWFGLSQTAAGRHVYALGNDAE